MKTALLKTALLILASVLISIAALAVCIAVVDATAHGFSSQDASILGGAALALVYAFKHA